MGPGLLALRAADAGEAVLEQTTVRVPPHLFVHEAPPETVAPLEALRPLPLDLLVVGLDEPVQRRRLGAARAVAATAPLGVVAWTGEARCHQVEGGVDRAALWASPSPEVWL